MKSPTGEPSKAVGRGARGLYETADTSSRGPMIPDRFFYPLAALVVAGLIGLALVYPQGEGMPSPGPFRRAMPAPTVRPAATAVRPPTPAAAPTPTSDASQVRTRPLP